MHCFSDEMRFACPAFKGVSCNVAYFVACLGVELELSMKHPLLALVDQEEWELLQPFAIRLKGGISASQNKIIIQQNLLTR